MKAIRAALRQLPRGPRAARLLGRLGIDARRYWLLMDLFGQLSERGEILDQLGRSGVALQAAAWLYAALSAFIGVLLIVTRTPPLAYGSIFLAVTAFLVLFVLLSEAGNSLVNPVEGLVLAHQPIDGATYTAAKLSHLTRIVLYLVPALNAAPALGGLLLKGAGWSYPLLHLAAALAVGFVAALLCCALYGWLIRLVPAARLKAAAQLAAMTPFLAMAASRGWLPRLRIPRWMPEQSGVRWAWGVALACAAAAIVVVGIRSLSADYLLRVNTIAHGGRSARAGRRRSRTGDLVARLCGGQPARAGFGFVSRMMRRDYQFRRQALPMLAYLLPGLIALAASGWRTDPFSGRFTTAHLAPHAIGMALFFVCTLLPFGNDYKGAWLFLLAPARIWRQFAGGVYAALWIPFVLVPHAAMLVLFAWPWGIPHAALFTAYSMAAASVYLALELRLIEGLPFGRQADAVRGAFMMPLMVVGGMAMAAAVGVQYFLVFRSPETVAAVTAAAGAAAFLLTRRSLGSLGESIRYGLGLLSAESGSIYKEIDL